MYFCWLDIGFFCDEVTDEKVNVSLESRFSLYLPKDFNQTKIAYTEAGGERNQSLSPMEIIKRDRYWVSGGIFLGKWDVLLQWASEYRAAVELLIQRRMMSSDQSVIYIMSNTMSPKTELQAYKPQEPHSNFTYLGYMAKNAGKKRETQNIIKNVPKPACSLDMTLEKFC